MIAALRPALRATRVRADRRRARGRAAAAVALGQVRPARGGGDAHRRGRADAGRAAGQRPVDRAAAARDGRRGGRAVHRRLDARARSSCRRSSRCWAGRRRRSAVRRASSREGNSARNPARTASTASALMIGLALVTLVGVLAAGLRTGFKNAVNKVFVADYAITATNNFSPIASSSEQARAERARRDRRSSACAPARGRRSARTSTSPAFPRTSAGDQGRLDRRAARRRRRSSATTARSSTRPTPTPSTCRSARRWRSRRRPARSCT